MYHRDVLTTLTILFVAFAAIPVRAERWTVTKVNGGTNGYNIVKSETNDPIIGETTHTLTCQNPGNEACIWSSVGRQPVLVGYAETAIENGQLQGEYSANVGGVEAHVEWTATDVYNTQIIETQADVH